MLVKQRFVKFSEEQLDERYQIYLNEADVDKDGDLHPKQNNEKRFVIERNYYQGQLDMLNNLGLSWERKNGKHKIFG